MDVQTGRGTRLCLLDILALSALLTLPTQLAAQVAQSDTSPGLPAEGASFLQTEATWQAEGFRVAEDGRRGRGAFLQLTDLGVAAEATTRGGGALRAFLQVLGIGGDDLADRTQDFQGVSNIEAPASWRLYQAWVEAELPSGVAALAGLYDLNADFYVTEASGVFLNPSHGIGPEFAFTGAGGPSIFPATSLAVRLLWEVREGLTWKAAILDATPGVPGAPEAMGVSLSREEGALAVTEVEHLRGAYTAGGGGWRAVLGGWAYTEPEAPLVASAAGTLEEGNQGVYGVLEWGAAWCDPEGPCLRGFLRGGLADAQVNALAAAWGAGVTLETRADGHLVGLGLAGARSGSAFRQASLQEGAYVGLDELNVELTLRVPLGSRFTLQPDLQYILDPGLDPFRSSVLVAGARIHLQF